MQNFIDKIAAMNAMYKLPLSSTLTIVPGEPVMSRLVKFQRTLTDEVNELSIIIDETKNVDTTSETILVNIADLLGDVVVYCFSEAAKYGIPMEEVLDIIMQSNESKLGTDGLPIYNEDGKFLKGPNYWKPEPKIKMLFGTLPL